MLDEEKQRLRCVEIEQLPIYADISRDRNYVSGRDNIVPIGRPVVRIRAMIPGKLIVRPDDDVMLSIGLRFTLPPGIGMRVYPFESQQAYFTVAPEILEDDMGEGMCVCCCPKIEPYVFSCGQKLGEVAFTLTNYPNITGEPEDFLQVKRWRKVYLGGRKCH